VRERALDLGEALVRVAPPIINKVTHLALDPTRVDERLDILIERVAADAGRCVWMVGPGTRPADLGVRLMARGFTVAMEFSAPILIKRGFKLVCHFVGLVPPRRTA